MAMTTIEKINAGFALALAVVVLIGLVSYRAMTRSIGSAVAVAETHEVIGALNRVQALLNDAESAQHGYLITGTPEYLARFPLGRIPAVEFDDG